MTDTKKLRELAMQATRGPWRAGNCHKHGHEERPGRMACYRVRTESGDGIGDDDAEFIAAANPQTVIDLLDRLEAAEAVCELIGDGAYQKGLGDRVADAMARWRRVREGK